MFKKNTKSEPKARRRLSVSKKQAGVGLLLLLIVAGAVYVFVGYGIQQFVVKPRLARINEIYRGLDLSDTKYVPVYTNISGEKRTYDWDGGRTHSSEVRYIHGADVKSTVDELDKKIKAIGFEYFDEPYAGSATIQYHYKSSEGEYIRLSVSSKLRDDAFQNFFLMNRNAKEYPAELLQSDVNAGPSNVTIKVNLDDNNE